ncbi:hypothetical protein TSAR_004229 [Trichomalopsis sarcophagae]|uniref:Uncharacterized protein n=1 Tax=Trichomalopsis sarcophagae TaxID=543379 RepID=A0A232EQ56_9HYME|nr:hypothetical protein TSAR_004229 [Trichomalopsis sarcophagae]
MRRGKGRPRKDEKEKKPANNMRNYLRN